MTGPVIPPHDSAVPPTTLSISAKDLSDAGLEPQLRSWIGSGANEPIADERITAVVGKDRLARTAESLGREPGELAAALAADLPRVIDTASPDGQVLRRTVDRRRQTLAEAAKAPEVEDLRSNRGEVHVDVEPVRACQSHLSKR
ncbi:YidB family protein [Streptomyces avermitilis]|uniref:YidB family protein n=1 Tax=Streptomyces avermitilis TaxID=33903 RepID=UPI0033D388B6